MWKEVVDISMRKTWVATACDSGIIYHQRIHLWLPPLTTYSFFQVKEELEQAQERFLTREKWYGTASS